MMLEFAEHIRVNEEDSIIKSQYMVLLIAMFEFVEGLESIFPQVFQMIFDTYDKDKTNVLKPIVMQTFAIMLYYNTEECIKALEQQGQLENFMRAFLQDASQMKQDYEIKRCLIGISQLLQTDFSKLPQTVHALMNQISQVAAILAIRSMEVAQKEITKR